MRKLLLSLLFLFSFGFSSFSQQVISSAGTRNPNLGNFENELKFNFLNLILLGSFEIGYERYLSESHSLEFQVLANDRFGFNSEGNGKKYKTNSAMTALNFYFGNKPSGRFHIYPFAKIRFGDFEEPTPSGGVITTDMTSFMLGAGFGYKWEVSEHFAFGPYASIARGFGEAANERFAPVELNGGFSLGYRF
jgi:hypothetical protein